MGGGWGGGRRRKVDRNSGAGSGCSFCFLLLPEPPPPPPPLVTLLSFPTRLVQLLHLICSHALLEELPQQHGRIGRRRQGELHHQRPTLPFSSSSSSSISYISSFSFSSSSSFFLFPISTISSSSSSSSSSVFLALQLAHKALPVPRQSLLLVFRQQVHITGSESFIRVCVPRWVGGWVGGWEESEKRAGGGD